MDRIKQINHNGNIFVRNDFNFKNKKLENFLINKCDLALGNFGNSQKALYVLPNKVIEATSLKIPIITGESIGPLEFFNEESMFFSKNNPTYLKDTIINVVNDQNSSYYLKVNNAHKIYKKYFSFDKFENLILNEFE